LLNRALHSSGAYPFRRSGEEPVSLQAIKFCTVVGGQSFHQFLYLEKREFSWDIGHHHQGEIRRRIRRWKTALGGGLSRTNEAVSDSTRDKQSYSEQTTRDAENTSLSNCRTTMESQLADNEPKNQTGNPGSRHSSSTSDSGVENVAESHHRAFPMGKKGITEEPVICSPEERNPLVKLPLIGERDPCHSRRRAPEHQNELNQGPDRHTKRLYASHA
jgi:hypothetical protein